jgi:hypothetical protein
MNAPHPFSRILRAWPVAVRPLVVGLLLAIGLLAGTPTTAQAPPHDPGQSPGTVPVPVPVVWAAPEPTPSTPNPTATPGAPDPTPAPGTTDPTAAPNPTATPGQTQAPDPAPGPTATTPGTSGSGDGGGGSSGPGWFDISGRIRAAIDSWLSGLVSSALNPVLDLLGRTVLATPDITAIPRVRELWTGSVIAADTVFVLFVLAGGVLVMTRESLQTRYSLKEVVPRIVVGFVTANLSLEVASRGIEFANAFTIAVVGPGLDPEAAGDRMAQLLVGSVQDQGSFLSLMGLVAVVLAVVLLGTYLVRVVLVVLLVVAAPLMLVFHALPATEAVAYLWWKAMAACLGVQLAQGVGLLVALRLFFTPDGAGVLGLPADSSGVVNLLVAVVLFYLLARIPVWAARMVFTSHRRSTLLGIAKSVVIVKTLGAVGLLGSRRRGGRR